MNSEMLDLKINPIVINLMDPKNKRIINKRNINFKHKVKRIEKKNYINNNKLSHTYDVKNNKPNYLYFE